ncbi:pilus assembly protein TadG-related protein [Microvirga massiliensis]|uniref:pilus assembly protein TadG-related protein n=1 Tax=Microvirga massiliensis TaxID=1033741 RepID=UPI00062B3104|nr:pilus assembly protein TadG-related protein [Microvirga massiliensis]
MPEFPGPFSRARKFLKDDGGAVLIWATLTVPVILGIYALSTDLGRLGGMHTELQDMADAAALAAAAQLDGKADSIVRANAEAAKVVNSSKFANSGGSLFDLVYTENYAELKAGPYLPEGEGPEAAKAGWVQAITNVGTSRAFLIGVVGGDTAMQTRARATAGTGYVACEVTPLRICDSQPTRWDEVAIGTQFKLKSRPGVNGDFAVVDDPNLPNPNGSDTARFLASETPNFCFTNNVKVDPGQSTSAVYDGLNVRFSIYSNSNKDLHQFPPAPNITKGNTSNQCELPHVVHGPPGGFPRDSNLIGDPNGFQGNGIWDKDGYLKANYGANYEATLSSTKPTLYAALTKAKTRYDVYLAELGITSAAEEVPMTSAQIRNAPGMVKRVTGEFPYPLDNPADSPMCSPLTDKVQGKPVSKFASYKPSRRIFYAAVVNCDGNTGNATPPRRSNRYVKFFMTEPVTKPDDPVDKKTVFGEFLGLIKANDGSGKLHAIVQLYPNP